MNTAEESKKEYTIYCMYGKGKPFFLSIYKTFFEAQAKLYEIIQLDEERHRIYYVDNNFFENKYKLGMQSNYYSIVERKVSEWEKYTAVNSKEKMRNKILAFTKFS